MVSKKYLKNIVPYHIWSQNIKRSSQNLFKTFPSLSRISVRFHTINDNKIIFKLKKSFLSKYPPRSLPMGTRQKQKKIIKKILKNREKIIFVR